MAFFAPTLGHDHHGAAPHGGPLTRLVDAAIHLFREVQAAHMRSVLNRFPDKLLTQIGITRADIPAYARALVSGEIEER